MTHLPSILRNLIFLILLVFGLSMAAHAASIADVVLPSYWESTEYTPAGTAGDSSYLTGSTPVGLCNSLKSSYEASTPTVWYDSGPPGPPPNDACAGGGYITTTWSSSVSNMVCLLEEDIDYCGEPQEGLGENISMVPECPSGYGYESSGVCVSTEDAVSDTPTGFVADLGAPDDCAPGNPVNPANGNKFQIETDYISGAPNSLSISRTYNSLYDSLVPLNLQEPDIVGARWHFSLDMQAIVKSIDIVDAGGYTSDVFGVSLIRPDGRRLDFWVETDSYGDIQFSSILKGKHNRLETVELISGTEIQYNRADGAIEIYELTHTNGDLAWMSISEIQYLDGSTAEFTYDGYDRLATVTQTPGAEYSISYDGNDRINSITVPGGYVTYEYDANGNFEVVTYPDSSEREYLYEDVSYPYLLTGIIDENLVQYAFYEYDSNERATLSEHAGGVGTYEFAYYSGFETDVTDPYNETITYDHQEVRGRTLRSSVSELSNTCSSTALDKDFDSVTGNLTAEYDANYNTIASYSYYNDDKTVEVTNAEYITTTYEYIDAARLDTVSNYATEIDFDYDGNGRLVTKTITDQSTYEEQEWTYTYNGNGRLASINGPRTDVTDTTTFTYHASGDLATVTNALSQTTSYDDYTSDGRVGTITEPSGIETEFSYTSRGWIDSITRAGLITTFDYDYVGNLTEITYPDSSTVEFVYDNAHRLIEVHDHDGNELIYALDSAGNRTETEIYASGTTLTFEQNQTFDTAGRLQSVIGSLNQTTEYDYDSNGYLIEIEDPLDYTVSYTLDSLNRVTTETIDYYSTSSDIYYDYYSGKVNSVTDPNYYSTDYSYNGFAELIELSSPDTGTTTYDYDSASNLVEKIDADGRELDYTYDALNRLLTITGTGYSVEFGYDEESNSVGMLGSMEDNSGDTKWLYNSLGYIAEKEVTPTGSSDLTTNYSYDTYGRLDDMTYPSGNIVTYSYASNGKVSGIQVNSSTLISNVTYNPFGPLESWDGSNGENYDRSYTLDGLIDSISYPDTTKNYDYDAAFQIVEIEDVANSSLTETMTYDPQGRLETYTRNSSTRTWSYDANGTRYEEDEGSLYRTYSAYANQIQDVYRNDLYTTEYDYTYDYAGNRISNNLLDYYYDESSRLIEIEDNSTTIAEYEYNGLGQRVKKIAGGITTYFIYDEDGHLIGEYPSTGPDVEYVWLANTPVAMIVTDTGTSIYHIYPDHLNTPRFLADSTGDVVWRWDSDAFGNGLADEDPDNDSTDVVMNLRFPGQFFDSETGTHYNYYRDYDPVIGSYVQSDPIGLGGGLNTYAYVSNNPLSNSDSTGLFLDTILDVGFLLYDGYRIFKDNVFGECDNLNENLAALGADSLSIILPGVTGGGAAVRAAVGPHSLVTHIPGKKLNQLRQRRWSQDSINQLVNNPYATRTATNRATGNSATAFFRADGHYVVRDNVTGNLVQMSDTRLTIGTSRGQWSPDASIINPVLPRR